MTTAPDAVAGASLLTLLGTALVVMGSPGPATISVTAVGGAFGVRRALPYLAGVVFGTTVVLLVVATGTASLLLSEPRLGPLLIGLSGAYIVYLAYRIATAPPLAVSAERRPPAFTGGLLLAMANPKAYLAIAAVFAGAGLGIQPPALEAAVKTLVLTGMIVLIHVAWLLAGASFTRLLSHPRASRIINIAFAAVLVASALPAILPRGG